MAHVTARVLAADAPHGQMPKGAIGPSGTIKAQYAGPQRPVTIGLYGVPARSEGGAQFHPVSFIVAPGSWHVREAAPIFTYGKQAFDPPKTQAGAALTNWVVAFGQEALPRAAARGPVHV